MTQTNFLLEYYVPLGDAVVVDDKKVWPYGAIKDGPSFKHKSFFDRPCYRTRKATQILGISRQTLWAAKESGRLEYGRHYICIGSPLAKKETCLWCVETIWDDKVFRRQYKERRSST